MTEKPDPITASGQALQLAMLSEEVRQFVSLLLNDMRLRYDLASSPIVINPHTLEMCHANTLRKGTIYEIHNFYGLMLETGEAINTPNS